MSRLLVPSPGAELLVQLDDLLELARPGGHAFAELSSAYAAVEEALNQADLQRARAITHHTVARIQPVAA